MMTQKNGTVVAKYDYLPFGSIASKFGTKTTDIQFTGHRADAENELIYMNARYYDSQLGRFLLHNSVIPDLEQPQMLNRFSYVINDPLGYVDLNGMEPTSVILDPGKERQPPEMVKGSVPTQGYVPQATNGVIGLYGAIRSYKRADSRGHFRLNGIDS